VERLGEYEGHGVLTTPPYIEPHVILTLQAPPPPPPLYKRHDRGSDFAIPEYVPYVISVFFCRTERMSACCSIVKNVSLQMHGFLSERN
jgi:hypothetical protein